MEQKNVKIENAAEIVYLPVSELYPHPDNPRKDVGDVSELAESIKAKGVMQNLTVVHGHYENGSHEPIEGGYTVIIGHRRRAGSIEAGLERVPCAIVEMDYREQVATMLLENIQRVDLTAFEQAQGFQMMMDLGDTVEGIAEKTGFSKKTVKHRLEMAKLNVKTLKEVSERQLTMADFDKLSGIKSIKKRNEVLASIGTHNFDSNVERAIKDELIAEKMPIFVEKAKAVGAKEMNSDDRWSSKYEKVCEVRVTDADEEKDFIPKKYLKDTLFYCVRDYWGDLEIYRKKPKEEAKKRPKAEIEREKDIEYRKKQLKSLHEMARVLRGNFAKELVMNAKNREKILAGAVGVLSANIVSYMYTVHARTVLEFIGKEVSNDFKINQAAFGEALAGEPNKTIPALIYLFFENDKNASYVQDVYNDYPKHKPNTFLDQLYDWLTSLGYEMSDDERALRDGTHEAFRVEGKA